MAKKTITELVEGIDKKIERMTHDITTLEGFAKDLLAMKLKLNSVIYSMDNFKSKTGCSANKMQCHATNIECGFTKMLEQSSNRSY